jgi:hypothetical protein
MLIDLLAKRADAARRALELARSKLEFSARRWAQIQSDETLGELRGAAAAFGGCQKAADDSVRAWARAVGSGERPPARTSNVIEM